MQEPRLHHVQCLSPRGLHRMAYWEWGDPRNARVLVCVHGLTRQGRDFDTLARAMCEEFRVICPDVVGRGQSDWLADPAGYNVPAYVADMVTLLARLDTDAVSWLGTSMGGLIGMGLTALPKAPVVRLVLNDIGPTLRAEALNRIGAHVGVVPRWATLDEAADYMLSISQGFGPHTREQWLELSRPQIKQDGDGVTLRVDPGIAVPFRATTPEMAATGEAMLWAAYDAIRCPTLLLRGADSDLLGRDTAQAMTQRGPKARLVEFDGVGHAPTLIAPDQLAAVREFLLAPMKTSRPGAASDVATDAAAPIVALADVHADQPAEQRLDGPAELAQLARARAFAEPLLTGQELDTGEEALAHADGVASILHGIGAAPSMRAAAYLVYAGDFLHKPEEVVTKAFGASHASLVMHTRKLVQIQRAAREAQVAGEQRGQQTERVRKMLLAFSRDLRVVLLRLASRLQTLRFFAASKRACPRPLAAESLQVFAPLANRLGIWQIKWELEDLAFRFLEPGQYRAVAGLLDEKRVEREQRVEAFRQRLADDLSTHGLKAEVQGRPKHLYSIWKKMQGKRLDFAQVLDVRALRVIVSDVPSCYAVLGRVHELFRVVQGELDDYIARPKPNGYQSLHTVVLDESERAVEVQIRTRAMHEHAEHGVAAHWAYKEAGAKGYGGASAAGEVDAKLAEARKAVLRQLLAWERDFVEQDAPAGAAKDAFFDDRIYVFTPNAEVVELPAGATPIDFAYVVHTTLGHRCRGAKVDGAMVPLNTALRSGQTVEVSTVKEGGPSLDWLNPELGYLQSPRSKAKVRAWFNALALQHTIARGREQVEKLLQREGKTAMKLDDLAAQLGFRHADALFEVVGKDEFSLRNIESLLRPAEPQPTPDEITALRLSRPDSQAAKGGVLVVGVESLMTTLSRCCRPAPPDAIGGYVTRGKGVAIHRAACSNFREMAQRAPERVIAVAWGRPSGDKASVYPIDVIVEAADRQGLLRDISEVFAKEGMNVTGVNTQTMKDVRGGTAWMTFTVEVADSARLARVLALVGRIDSVRSARRK